MVILYSPSYIHVLVSFFFNDPATTQIYAYLHTLSLHDALPILVLTFLPSPPRRKSSLPDGSAAKVSETRPQKTKLKIARRGEFFAARPAGRTDEHTSELQSLMRISYAVFCLKKKKHKR